MRSRAAPPHPRIYRVPPPPPGWNLAFPVIISPIVFNMCEHLHYESVYISKSYTTSKNAIDRRQYTERGSCSVVSTITSIVNILDLLFASPFSEISLGMYINQCKINIASPLWCIVVLLPRKRFFSDFEGV